VLRPRSYVNGLITKQERPWFRELWPFVNELVAVDLPEKRLIVTQLETDAWGVTGEQVFAVARENISARGEELALTPGETFILHDADGGSYADSMIVANGWLSRLSIPDGPRPLVFFPGDGTLMVGTDAPDVAPAMFEGAEEMYLEAERCISPQGYTIEGGTVVPFDQAGPHALRSLALRARTLLASTEYNAQTEFLRDHYENELLPQYVGAAMVIQTPWGPRTTAVWGEGIPWELPQTDYVTLFTADRSDSFAVPFPILADAVGILPIPGLTPVRYRANEFPTPELLAALRPHAVELLSGDPSGRSGNADF
jgi:hypothetical protein